MMVTRNEIKAFLKAAMVEDGWEGQSLQGILWDVQEEVRLEREAERKNGETHTQMVIERVTDRLIAGDSIIKVDEFPIVEKYINQLEAQLPGSLQNEVPSMILALKEQVRGAAEIEALCAKAEGYLGEEWEDALRACLVLNRACKIWFAAGGTLRSYQMKAGLIN